MPIKCPSTLEWGETPFDNLTHEEALLMLKQFYSALRSAESALHVLSWAHEASPFWGVEQGTGGRAKARVEAALALADPQGKDDGRERSSRCFFRYADHLLFPEIPMTSFDKWWIAVDGDEMVTGNDDGTPPTTFGKTYRPLEMSDLAPRQRAPEG